MRNFKLGHYPGYALLATALLLCFHDRLGRRRRIGLAVLVAVSVLFHMSVLPAVAVLLPVGLLAARLLDPAIPAGRGALRTVVALACAGALALAGSSGLKAIFGQEVRSPPFLQGRVIVDGPGQQFLRETCTERAWAACLWKDATLYYTDDIIWPDETWHDLPLITDPAERRRFLDETPAVVLGTLLRHPFAQLRASARNALVQLARFNVASDVGEALYGLLHAKDDRRMRVAGIVPSIGPCLAEGGARACDHGPLFRALQLLHYAVVAASLAVLGACALRWTGWRGGADAAEVPRHGRRLVAFAVVVLAGVVLNAVVCGAFSNPFGRYQARVVWLVPMTALLLLEWARQQAGWAGLRWRPAATAPSGAGTDPRAPAR